MAGFWDQFGRSAVSSMQQSAPLGAEIFRDKRRKEEAAQKAAQDRILQILGFAQKQPAGQRTALEGQDFGEFNPVARMLLGEKPAPPKPNVYNLPTRGLVEYVPGAEGARAIPGTEPLQKQENPYTTQTIEGQVYYVPKDPASGLEVVKARGIDGKPEKTKYTPRTMADGRVGYFSTNPDDPVIVPDQPAKPTPERDPLTRTTPSGLAQYNRQTGQWDIVIPKGVDPMEVAMQAAMDIKTIQELIDNAGTQYPFFGPDAAKQEAERLYGPLLQKLKAIVADNTGVLPEGSSLEDLINSMPDR